MEYNRQRWAQVRDYWFVLITMLALAGCATGNPIAIAETPAQKAYAIERSYNIILAGAVELAQDSSTPASLKRAIGRVETRTTPLVDSLSAAVTDYIVARAQFSQGMTTQQKLDVFSRNLENWINQAERALTDLAAAIDGGG